MGFFNFKDKNEVVLHAERVGVGLRQINEELRKNQSATPLVRGLCSAISDEMQKMYATADKLSANDKLTLSLSYNGKMILYNDFIREIEYFRRMLLNNYGVQLF